MKNDKGPAPAVGDLVLMMDPYGDDFAPARVEHVDLVAGVPMVTAADVEGQGRITSWWDSRYFRRHP